MVSIVGVGSTIEGRRVVFHQSSCDCLDTAFAEAEFLRTSVIPEVPALVNWKLVLRDDDVIVEQWSMDDAPSATEHRLYTGDNEDVAYHLRRNRLG